MSGKSFQFLADLYTGLPNEFSPYANRRSFYFFIQNASDYPFTAKPSPFFLTPITGTTISVKRSFYSQFNEWPYAYSECRVKENNELIGEPLVEPYLFDQVVANNFTYTRETCINFCAQLMSKQVCNCNYYAWPLRVDDFDICLTSAQTACAMNFFYNTFIVGDFIKNNCLDKCPIECNIRTFTTSQSYFKFPNSNQVANLLYYDDVFMPAHTNQTDATDFYSLYDNMLSVSVFYESLSYSITEERPAIVMTELIGSIGGHLHLFLGMSLLSFFEIIELGAFAFIISKTKSIVENADQKLKKHIEFLRMDGLPNIIKAKNVIFKIGWATIFASSFCIFVWLIVGTVTEYLKYDVSKLTNKHSETFVSSNEKISIFAAIKLECLFLSL